ncbi:MAG: carbonic anhydrase [Bacteroidetes bacterium]|nr:carbonic anhydrase [Bacteroidota bacterium]
MSHSKKLIPVNSQKDILEEYKNTPIEKLFKYHNLGKKFTKYKSAQLLVGMCMDNRKHLHIPDNFSFIIRTGGANLRFSQFELSFAIAIGGIKYIAIIGHDKCGMVNLKAKKNKFISGLVKSAGLKLNEAQKHFNQFVDKYEIGNEVDFVLSEVKRLRLQYPKIKVAPLLYLVENGRLYFIK